MELKKCIFTKTLIIVPWPAASKCLARVVTCLFKDIRLRGRANYVCRGKKRRGNIAARSVMDEQDYHPETHTRHHIRSAQPHTDQLRYLIV